MCPGRRHKLRFGPGVFAPTGLGSADGESRGWRDSRGWHADLAEPSANRLGGLRPDDGRLLSRARPGRAHGPPVPSADVYRRRGGARPPRSTPDGPNAATHDLVGDRTRWALVGRLAAH